MIRVAVWGTGMMGQGLLGFILDRPKDIDLVGVIVTNPAKEDHSVGELLGRECTVTMTTDFESVLGRTTRRGMHLHSEQPGRDHESGGARGQGGLRRRSASRSACPTLGERSGVGGPVRRARQGARRQHPRHRREPRLRARRAHRHVELDLPPHRSYRGFARQRPLAVRPDRHGQPGRRHHRRAVRGRHRRRHHRRAHRVPGIHQPDRQGARLDDRRDRRDPRADRHDRRALHATRARGTG